MVLPFKHGIKIVGLIGALFRSQNADTNDVSDNDLQRLTVLFIHGKHEEWQHGDDHDERSCADGQAAFQNKKQRYADERPAAETNQLPLG